MTMKFAYIVLLAMAGSVYGQECVDSDGDGWGWDGSKSCIVTANQTGGCDYSNAASNGGWGWDQVEGVSCPPVGQVQDDPVKELDGIASAIVGTWLCDEEIFFDGQWNVEKGTETFAGVSVDMFTQRSTFNSDGSYFSEVSRNQSTGQFTTQDNSTWALNDFRFSIGTESFTRIAFEDSTFSFYRDDTHRRACTR